MRQLFLVIIAVLRKIWSILSRNIYLIKLKFQNCEFLNNDIIIFATRKYIFPKTNTTFKYYANFQITIIIFAPRRYILLKRLILCEFFFESLFCIYVCIFMMIIIIFCSCEFLWESFCIVCIHVCIFIMNNSNICSMYVYL